MKHILCCLIERYPSFEFIRIKYPYNKIRNELKELGIVMEFSPIEHWSLQLAAKYDRIVTHGCPSPNLINLFKSNKFSIFVDDKFWDLMPSNPTPQRQSDVMALFWCFEHAQTVVATTKYLAETINYPSKTIWADNYIDLEWVDNKSEEILYTGGHSHYSDMQLINYEGDRKLIFWTHTMPDKYCNYSRDLYGMPALQPKVNIGYINQTNNYQQYQTWMNNLSFGVGLCPLVDHPFNWSKSKLKVLEYTKKGAVSLCSPIMPYSDIPSECVVFVQDNNWTEAINYAFANREKIYKNCFEWVKDNYTWTKSNKQRWIDCYVNL